MIWFITIWLPCVAWNLCYFGGRMDRFTLALIVLLAPLATIAIACCCLSPKSHRTSGNEGKPNDQSPTS